MEYHKEVSLSMVQLTRSVLVPNHMCGALLIQVKIRSNGFSFMYLRVFSLKRNHKIPVYADSDTAKYLRSSFSYCFNNFPGYRAILKLKDLKKKISFKKYGKSISIKSIAVQHGRILSQSFIINKSCAYVSDANKIYAKDLKYFKNLKYLVIDCLRYNPHPSHFNLSDVIELTKILNPKKTILTNLNTDMDYNYLSKILPKNIVPGYDGMSFYI